MKKIIARFLLLALAGLLTAQVACDLPLTIFTPVHSDALPSITPTATEIPYQDCAWNWATETLPDLSEQVQAEMDAAGLEGLTVVAEAYGENCYGDSDEVLRFAVMETDFRISARVSSINDHLMLGNLLEKILIVLDGFPPNATPGPSPGYIGVNFHARDGELVLWFPVAEGKSARALGLHGTALLDQLQNK